MSREPSNKKILVVVKQFMTLLYSHYVFSFNNE